MLGLDGQRGLGRGFALAVPGDDLELNLIGGPHFGGNSHLQSPLVVGRFLVGLRFFAGGRRFAGGRQGDLDPRRQRPPAHGRGGNGELGVGPGLERRRAHDKQPELLGGDRRQLSLVPQVSPDREHYQERGGDRHDPVGRRASGRTRRPLTKEGAAVGPPAATAALPRRPVCQDREAVRRRQAAGRPRPTSGPSSGLGVGRRPCRIGADPLRSSAALAGREQVVNQFQQLLLSRGCPFPSRPFGLSDHLLGELLHGANRIRVLTVPTGTPIVSAICS